MGEYYLIIEIYRYNNIRDKFYNSRDFIFNLVFRNIFRCIIF